MKLALSLKSPIPQEAILDLRNQIVEWQVDNLDFEDELYQTVTFYILQTLIAFHLVEFGLWINDIDIQENQYSLTEILEPLPWILQGIRNNQGFDWGFYKGLKQTNLFFTYQSNDVYLLKIYSDIINGENLQETFSKQTLVEILTDLKLTFETYVKQHLADVLPKNYLAMFDNFYDLVW